MPKISGAGISANDDEVDRQTAGLDTVKRMVDVLPNDGTGAAAMSDTEGFSIGKAYAACRSADAKSECRWLKFFMDCGHTVWHKMPGCCLFWSMFRVVFHSVSMISVWNYPSTGL